MSMKFTALALEHGPVDAFEKLLLLALADRANEHGVCWPSREDLMRRTGASYATVSRKLRMLEATGWVQRQRRFNSSTVFRVNVQRLLRLEADAVAQRRVHVPKGFEPFEDEVAQPIENKGSVHSDLTSVHCDTHISSQRTDEPVINQSLKKKPAALKISDLGGFALKCLREGKPVPLGGGVQLPRSDARYQRLAADLEDLRKGKLLNQEGTECI